MENVVNNPNSNEPGSGMWGFLSVLLIVVAIIALFIFGLPYLRSAFRGSGTTQVNIPDQVDVNVSLPNNQ